MAHLSTAIKNNMLLGKLTGHFAPFKHVFCNRDRRFLPPFIIKIDNKYIGIVLSYVKHDERNVLWIRKIWINPKVFVNSTPTGVNGRHPYFDTIAQVLQLFMQTLTPTFKEFHINTLCYKSYRTEEDKAILHPLKWFGFNDDVEKTLRNYVPTTSWREREELPYHIYTKALL